MKMVNTAVTAALAASGLFAGGAVALAQGPGPGPAPTEVGVSGAPSYRATTWAAVNVRICPSTACLPAAGGPIPAGATTGVHCWAHGESVTDFGYTNDVWLNVGRQDGGSQWSSAIYFVGDEYGNLPQDAECADVPQPPTTTRPAPTTTARPEPTVTATPRPTATTSPQPTFTTPQPTATTSPQPTVTMTATPEPTRG
ncbi:hypothetical protein [Saccharothrix sp. HUAS TT1]|uniref:hypothetical protein n=1 Tax=unclassified Saccharothrix TaxID=2593673 RepID=UPI00345B80E3